MQQHSSQSFVIPNAAIPFDQFVQKILLVLAPIRRSSLSNMDTQTWIFPTAIHPLKPTTTELPFFRLPVTTRAPNTPHRFTDDDFRQNFRNIIESIRKNRQPNAIKCNQMQQ